MKFMKFKHFIHSSVVSGFHFEENKNKELEKIEIKDNEGIDFK
jgi:hypothetical protein